MRDAMVSQNARIWAIKIITTTEAAKRLGVTPNRVRALIEAKRLKAFKYGREWLIDPKDLEAVKSRSWGVRAKPQRSDRRGETKFYFWAVPAGVV
jgi:excisionase family DNA binding protein